MKKKKLQRTDEWKVVKAVGKKVLSSLLCAFLCVNNTSSLMVYATETEPETEVETQTLEYCSHGKEKSESCVLCVQEGIQEIVAILSETKSIEQPMQTIYDDVESVYDNYVKLNEEELSQLTEDEFNWMEFLLADEQALITLLDELDRQVNENGAASEESLAQLYSLVSNSYVGFIQNKEAEEQEEVEEEIDKESQDSNQQQESLSNDLSIEERDEKIHNEGQVEDPNTGPKDQATSEIMEIETAVIKEDGREDQDIKTNPSFSVDFSKQFTLHIAIKSQLNLPNKKVEITVPDGLTVVEFPQPQRGDMAEKVMPESAEQLQGNSNYGDYIPKNGKITYSLKSTATENSFNLILAPDTVLWNRRQNQTLADSLIIKTYSKDTNEESIQTDYDEINAKVMIAGKYLQDASDHRALQTGPRLSAIGVKNGIPTESNTPFSLRQVWLNPDKDYIDMPQFFKDLEITIALPYFEKSGEKHYAVLDHIAYDLAGTSDRPNDLDPKNHKDEQGNEKNGFHFEQTVKPNHTVTLKWSNLYLRYGQDYFTPFFKWEEGNCPDSNNNVKWGSDLIHNTGTAEPTCYEGGEPSTGTSAVGGKITWQDESTWHIWNGKFTTFSFTAYSEESIVVNGSKTQKIYNAYDSDPNIVYYLGQFQIVNHGGKASAPKTLEFEYSSLGIGVIAQKIPSTSGNDISNIQYKTTKEREWQKYPGKLVSSGGFATFTSELAGLGENEYFTAIKADVGSYERDFVSYVASRSSDPTSGYGATFGKLLTKNEETYSKFASMKISDTDTVSEVNPETTSYTVVTTSTPGEIPTGMEQAYKEGQMLERLPVLSKTSVTAGDTVTFNGLLSSSAYPYSSNNIMTDPEIYIRLPEKISINNLQLYREIGRRADKVFLSNLVTETEIPQRTFIDKSRYSFHEISTPSTEESKKETYKTYKIDFTNKSDPEKIGWFSENLGQYQIGISFDMKIAKDSDAMTLDMRDCVRFKSKSLRVTSNNGTLSQFQVVDSYKMDPDSNTSERMSTLNVNTPETKLSVVAARLGLDFTFGARVADKGSIPEFDPKQYTNFEIDNEKVYLKDENHVIDMLFTLQNNTGRTFSKADAQAFYYFIPVPKEGDLWDSHMQNEAFEFDMNLTRAPSLSGGSKENVVVTYATDIDSNVHSGNEKHYTNKEKYLTEDQLLVGCETDKEKEEKWKQVKMIRIAAKENVESISEKAYLAVNMRLEPTFRNDQDHFDDMADLVGSEINFGPCGVSPYSVGMTQNQGHNPLPRIQVEFQTGVIEGKVFIDKNYNGIFDAEDEAYTDSKVTVKAQHQNETVADLAEIQELVTQDGNFKFNRRRADTYQVTIVNPGSADASSEHPLRFTLPDNKFFSISENQKMATATVILDMNQKPNGIKDAQTLQFGLQTPHTITFNTTNAELSTTSMKVWHGEELNAVPLVSVKEGYRLTGWKVKGQDRVFSDAEIKEIPVSNDMTVTAVVEKLYTLTYDGNGNIAGKVPSSSQHIHKEQVIPNYNGTGDLNKGVKTIFVGWSTTQIPEVLSEDASKETIEQIISNDAHEMPAHDVKLFAVYAYDKNGNGNPDYRDDAVHVRYHGNNNTHEDIICSHHHVSGETTKLSVSGMVSGKKVKHDELQSSATSEIQTYTFKYGTHIFIGWSTSPMPDVIETKDQYDNLKNSITTEITMLPTKEKEEEKNEGLYADEDGNTNVYAVWATDRNENEIADYLEERQLTYDGHAIKGTVNSLPDPVTKTIEHKSLIQNDKVTLTKEAPKHSSVKKNESDSEDTNVVFIGWISKPLSTILSREDLEPTTISEVTIRNDDEIVYAVWGYDEDKNGIADVLETYSLKYDLNGGNGDIPEIKKGIKKGEITSITDKKDFTRQEKEVFVGWSLLQQEGAFAAAQGNLINDILISGNEIRMGTKDITLYAVWVKDTNANGIPDYTELVKVSYDGNAQQSGNVSSLPNASLHLPGSVAGLDFSKTPIHSDVNGKKVVFIGWTTTKDEKIYQEADTTPTTVKEITIPESTNGKKPADQIVYAVWGYDEDANGKADVLETFTLSYDLNGGSGTRPERVSNLKKGTSVNLAEGKNLKRKSKEIFVGWGITPVVEALDASTKEETINQILQANSNYSMPRQNIVLYAIWAMDINENGTPDYNETKYQVQYNANNGQANESVNCSHQHVAKETCALLKNASNGTLRFTKEHAVFIGWSKTRHPENIQTTAEAKKAGIIAELQITDGETNVYAVWAEDKNSNGSADFTETGYSILYHSNNDKGMVIRCGHHHVEKEAVTLFEPDQLVGSEDDINASAPHTFTRDQAVLIGWSKEKKQELVTSFSEKETAGIITQIDSMPASDQDVYAVWAIDQNKNGTPDYDESLYTLTFDANGGSIKASSSTYLYGETITLSKEPIHTDPQLVFAGWSETKLKPLSAGDQRPSLITKTYKMPNHDTTLYAVWTKDINRNGIADYLERSLTLNYDGNGSGATINGLPASSKNHVAGEQVELSQEKPSYGIDNVVFLGWSEKKSDSIYRANDPQPTLINTIRFGGKDLTVYAAWGYDSNKDGIADIDTSYIVSYDPNGGTGTIPQPSSHRAQESFTLHNHTNLVRQNCLFVGWSTKKINKVLDEDASPDDINSIIAADDYTMPSHDVTFYAVWAIDSNHNGKPDYAEQAVHVRYHANNGTDQTFTCSHHHVVGTEATLFRTAPDGFTKSNALFVGWSLEKHEDIRTKGQLETVKFVESLEMKRSQNNVYAVWVTDSNGDGVADYEALYLVSYSPNGAIGNAPASSSHHEGDIVHIVQQVNELKKDGAIFAGWSETPINQTFSAQADPTLVKQIMTNYTMSMPSRNVTLYAVWAEDQNGDSIPDYGQNAHHVRYHANNGTSDTLECAHHHLEGTKAELVADAMNLYGKLNQSDTNKNHSFTMEDAVFMGWTTIKPESSIQSSEEEIKKYSIVSSITIQKEGNDMYALWAKDINHNGTADFLEHVKVTYEANAKESDVQNMPNDTDIHLPGDTIQLTGKPTCQNIDETPVVFIGWTKKQNPSIVKRTDALPQTLEELTFGKKDETVYALWGTDTNNDGTADVFDTYTLTYDLNGGKGIVPKPQNNIAKASNITISSKNDYTRNPKEVFVGWSLQKHKDPLKKSAEVLAPNSLYVMPVKDITLYAVWAQDNNGNGIADFYEKSLTIHYEGNAQNQGVLNNVPSDSTNHIVGETVTLEKKLPTHSAVDGKSIVCLGWSKELIDTIYKREDPLPDLIDQISLSDHDETLYAAWGYDSNHDGRADILDTYQVQYDANGGHGLDLATKKYRANESYTILHPQKTFKKDDLVFAGWSLEKLDTILKVDSNIEILKKLVTDDTPIMPYHDVTYYAVWAKDEDHDGTPDFAQNTAHIYYHANNVEEGEPELVVICPHHHLNGMNAELAQNANALYGSTEKDEHLKNYTFQKENAVFIGWSSQRIDLVDSKEKQQSLHLLDQVVLSTKAKTTNGSDVYAVWAIDTNQNNIPDYEEWIHLTYNANGGKDNSMPVDTKNYFPQANVPLIEEGKMAHRDENESAIVFIGWTSQKEDHIFKREEKAPTTIHTLTLQDKDATIYAAWGYDSNRDGIADVLETYSLAYDLNQGKGKRPESLTGLKKGAAIQLASESLLTRNEDEVFVGWSETQEKNAIEADATKSQLDLIKKPGSAWVVGPDDQILYAVWAKDHNHNGIADYMEKRFTLFYEGNAQNEGTVTSLPTSSKNHILNDRVTLVAKSPEHSDVNGVPVKFIGWSQQKIDHIFEREDPMPSTIQMITFESQDIHVYALWGYDRDGNGKADLLKDYTLSYDLNGKEGTVPSPQTVKAGSKIILEHPQGLKKGDAIFAGWSTEKIDLIVNVDPDIEILKTIVTNDEYMMPSNDVIVYALWAEDLDHNGIPDYAEKAVHISYHSNTGDEEQVVICPHHHIVQTKAVLSSSAQHLYGRTKEDATIKNHSFKKEKALFVGWSKTPQNDIETLEDHAKISQELLDSEIVLEDVNDVYAVWASDRNENGVADHQEFVRLNYDANAKEGLVKNLPESRKQCLPGATIVLEGEPVHEAVDGIQVKFIGWSQEALPILERKDEDPTSLLVQEVKLENHDLTVYAVWGYDTDQNGIADVLETYTLSYHLNGGRGELPTHVDPIKKGEQVSIFDQQAFVRSEDEVFVGWSLQQHEEAVDGKLYEKLKFSDKDLTMPANNVTLYALWAQDANQNGVADFKEMVQLIYNANTNSIGKAHGMPSRSFHLPGDTITLSQKKPTMSVNDGKRVVWIGWSEKALPIYSREDEDPENHLIKEVELIDQDQIVYAVWGYDLDRNGIADVFDTYSVYYDLNGGKGGDQKTQTNVKKGTKITVPNSDDLTRNENEVFAGWSLSKHEQAFGLDQNEELESLRVKEPVTMEAKDLTFYALWKKVDPEKEPTFTITYDLNGGSWNDPTTFTYPKGTLFMAHEAPIRDGYRFIGWKDGKGHTFDPGEPLMIQEDMTWIAVWKEIPKRSVSSRREPASWTERSNRSSARTASATHQTIWFASMFVSTCVLGMLSKKGKKKK